MALIESKKSILLWPEVFEKEDVENRSDAELCAAGLKAWASVLVGVERPESFGRIIAQIAHKLKILGTPSSFMECGDRYVKT